MFEVYAIWNKQAKKLYIGQTKDLDERMRLHNEKVLKGYTSRFRGSWDIIYREKVGTRNEALIRERQLKSHQGREFIKQYIPR